MYQYIKLGVPAAAVGAGVAAGLFLGGPITKLPVVGQNVYAQDAVLIVVGAIVAGVFHHSQLGLLFGLGLAGLGVAKAIFDAMGQAQTIGAGS